MMRNLKLLITTFMLVALLAACQPAGGQPGALEPPVGVTPEASVTPDPAAAFIAAARAHLVGELGIDDSAIALVSAAPAEFSDSCLGLGGPAESCLQAVTPGWLVMLDVDGQTYELHTDETGEQVRLASDISSIPVDPEAATAAAMAYLAGQLAVDESVIKVVALEAAEFSDSCLGLGGPAESCLQAITPGWLFTLGVAGQEYEVRSDGTGQVVRMAEAAE
ncbi:conserved exported protein of unknown function [Candidatus Promineifilum breve]|uniref:PepSY domain-containing protein n=1 Tax=Candidatus Promineifilum breve TaxID=1806508 RepID=A0A160T6I8_9CHLR|nr:hypothetical protein [Candidatus Promineifilum breve]CUS04878.2 conserved exported protein of unknown function [Candidatus Promineifilum breve]